MDDVNDIDGDFGDDWRLEIKVYDEYIINSYEDPLQ